MPERLVQVAGGPLDQTGIDWRGEGEARRVTSPVRCDHTITITTSGCDGRARPVDPGRPQWRRHDQGLKRVRVIWAGPGRFGIARRPRDAGR